MNCTKPLLPFCALLAVAIISCRDPEPTGVAAFSAPLRSSRSLSPTCLPTPIAKANDVGLNVHGLSDPNNATNDGMRSQIAALTRAANIGWVRVDVDWSSIQRDGPNYWNWLDVDSTMVRAYCQGLNVLASVKYSPRWASADSSSGEFDHYGPRDSTDWARFVGEAVSRYPWVGYWSVWNEPNDLGFFRQSATDYARMVSWASPAIHANSDGRGPRSLVGGELVVAATNAGLWIDTLLTTEGSHVDVLAVHMYGQPMDTLLVKVVNRPSVVAQSKEVWLTETNLTGCHNNAGQQSNPPCVDAYGGSGGLTSDRNYIDDDAQAAYEDSTISFMRRAASRWTKTFFYDSAEEVEQGANAQDYGIFGGWTAQALYGKRAYYHLAAASGASPQISLTGPTSIVGGQSATFSASITTGGPASGYYFEWHVICSARSSPDGDCVGTNEVWDAGWGLSSVTVDAPVVTGTMQVIAYIRATEPDSPVSPAYAAKGSKKVGISQF